MLSLSPETGNQASPQDTTSFTFEVDNVPPKQGKLDLGNFDSTLSILIGSRKAQVRNSSHQKDETSRFVYNSYKMTGAVVAIHSAFMNHYNLSLSVSDFNLMIAQGLALHMEQHAEDLRPHFVNFEGKEKIKVEVLREDWFEIVELVTLEVRKRVKTDLYDVMIDDTSVATKVSKIASEIAIMDSHKHYFQYSGVCLCGIPKITLVGSPDDWERLRSKVKKLEELNDGDKLKLGWWLKELVPLVNNIVDQAISRKVDQEFWKDIYKYQTRAKKHPYDSSEEITGWILRFIPYLKSGSRNHSSWKPTPGSLPVGVSQAPFTLEIGGQKKDLTLYGGFIGAELVGDDTIKPAHFYAVGESEQEKKNARSRW